MVWQSTITTANVISVPDADKLAVEGSLIAVELATIAADNGAVVHVVDTATIATMELHTVFFPQQRIVSAAIKF